MRKLPAGLSALALAIVAAVGTPTPALAATGDIGNTCVADIAPSNYTVLITANAPGSPLPATAPAGGVVTKATITLPSTGSVFPTKFKVARATGTTDQYAVVAESAVINVTGGQQSYPVRIPIAAGDLIGLGGAYSFACSSTGSTAAALSSDAAVGTTATYTNGPNTSVPLVATVEPDADHDGYGDVTQDPCPRSAALHTPCPEVRLASFAASSGKAITVVVTTNNDTAVTVTGLAKVGHKKVTLSGGTQTVQAGSLGQFKVRLPRALKAALAALPAHRSIKVTLTASATDATGAVSTSASKVKVPGTRH